MGRFVLVASFYNGSKTLYSKALGDEHAWVMDLGGRMPPLPGLAAADSKAETKMVRIVALDDVADRKLIGSSWLQMNDALNGVAKAFPMLAGQKMPKPDVSNLRRASTSSENLSMNRKPCSATNHSIPWRI